MDGKLLLVAATFEELAPLFTHFNWPKASRIVEQDIDVLITGAGIPATAFALGQQLNQPYRLILNAGIAGSFTPDLALGTVVNVVEDTFSELGAQDGDHFIAIDELGFGESCFQATYSNVPVLKPLPSVRGITVNQVHGHTESIDTLLNRLPVQTESMEGAAVFYAAHRVGTPVAQVRSISNYIEQRNRANWNITLAIANLNTWLIQHLPHI